MTDATWKLIAKRYGEDIAQETAIRYFLQYPPVDNERHWCARVAWRIFVDQARKRPRDANGNVYSHEAASLDSWRDGDDLPPSPALTVPAEQERLAIARELLAYVLARLTPSTQHLDPLAARTAPLSNAQRIAGYRKLRAITADAHAKGLL